MEKKKLCERVQDEYERTIYTIDKKFGKGYALKNPKLVQDLMYLLQISDDKNLEELIEEEGGC